MPAGSLATIAADAAFPALADATSEAYLLPLLQNAFGTRLSVGAIEVLNHKPGRRCTIRYRLDTAAGEKRAIIAKWYRDVDEAEVLYRRMSWLAAEARVVGLSMPAVLGFDCDRGVILIQHVEGREVRDVVMDRDLHPFALAGSWLGQLHSLTAPFGLFEIKTIDREMAKARAWSEDVRAVLGELSALLDEVFAGMEPASRRLAAMTPVLIHRDYYPANLLWEGQSVWGIDFDQMALGDAGVDIGAFVAQTEKLALRAGRPAEDVIDHARVFLEAYQTKRPIDLEPRLRFFKAYTLLQVASAEVRRRRSDWRRLASAFVERAVREVQEPEAT